MCMYSVLYNNTQVKPPRIHGGVSVQNADEKTKAEMSLHVHLHHSIRLLIRHGEIRRVVASTELPYQVFVAVKKQNSSESCPREAL